MARSVHGFLIVLTGAAMTACVVPPPLEVEQAADAGPNSPPVIIEARDSAANSLRPPSTLVVNSNIATPSLDIQVFAFDLDLADELTVRLFVDYTSITPPRVTCVAPGPSELATRSITCPTNGLCATNTESEHTLEIEAYDRPPEINQPFRNAPGQFFSTWTLHLSCINVAP